MFHYTGIDGEKLSEESYVDNYISYFFEFLNNQEIEIGGEGKGKLAKVFSRIAESFNGKYRKGGDPYISHLIEVTKIFIENTGISNINFDDIIISLLHDSIEDISHETFHSLQKDFGNYVALGVLVLSKPELEKDTNKSEEQLKEERNEKYYPRFHSLETLRHHLQEKIDKEGIVIETERIDALSRIVAKIKLSDRIHNLRTMPLKKYSNDTTGFSIEKKEEKLRESGKYFRSILQEIGNINLIIAFGKAEFFGNHSIFGEKIRKKIR